MKKYEVEDLAKEIEEGVISSLIICLLGVWILNNLEKLE